MIQEFPRENIKLSYENMVHKKVYDCDWVVAVPQGKKCFAWFTMNYETCQPVCWLVSSDYKMVKPIVACFDKRLSIGTILYGTVFQYEKNQVFTVEDILFYKGQNKVHTVYKEKLECLYRIFEKEINQTAIYGEQFTIFGLPIMKSNFAELLQCIASLQYKISHIQYRYLNKGTNVEAISCLQYIKPSAHFMQYKNNTLVEAVFRVKPDIQNDIYHLFVYHAGNRDHYYDIAFIPDYKTSVMMNRLFRIIKENANLDALEESDDEEEFESERVDKFVHLDKVVLMSCQYNWKFKRWVPVCAVKPNEKTVTLRDLEQQKQEQKEQKEVREKQEYKNHQSYRYNNKQYVPKRKSLNN
jgi:hypothetical protein